MAGDLRLKGQEVQVSIVRGGDVEDTITAIVNLNLTFDSQIKAQGYLGEKNDRHDATFVGIKGNLEYHSNGSRWLRFLLAIIGYQKRNDPGLVINIGNTFFYPGGDEPTILIPDVKFGPQSIAVGSRSDYVSKKLDFVADNAEISGV